MSDLISRADAIDTVEELNRKVNDGRENDTICTSDVLRRIKALPSAEAVQGEWIFEPKDAIELMFTKPKCSECGFESADGGNFCSNCGAKMKGAGHETD